MASNVSCGIRCDGPVIVIAATGDACRSKSPQVCRILEGMQRQQLVQNDHFGPDETTKLGRLAGRLTNLTHGHNRAFGQFARRHASADHKLFLAGWSDSRWQVLRERIKDRLVFGLVGELHGFSGIVLLVVEFRSDNLRAISLASERAAPAGVADAV